MGKRLLYLVLGYRILTVPPELRGKVFDLLFRRHIDFCGEKTGKNGVLFLWISRKYCALLEAYLAEEGLTDAVFSDLRGLPVVFRFFLRRPGIAVGALLLLCWSFFAQRMIWDIRIEGNTVTPDQEIIDLLTDLGCGYGDWYPSIDFDHLHAKFMAESPTIGWISVYMNGTVAEVQVRELIRRPPKDQRENTFANVVAAESGIIERVMVYEGQAAVVSGEFVVPGAVLISGVMERKDLTVPEGGIRYEYAAGEVFAKVVRRIDVDISLEREEKAYTGEKKRQWSVKIFGNVVNLFKNTGIDEGKYDKIEKERRLILGGICALPVWVTETEYLAYEHVKETLTPREAADRAFAELRRQTDLATAGCELLERTTETGMENGVYTIRCRLLCLKDIAETVEFTVTP